VQGKTEASYALANLSNNEDNQAAIAEAGGIAPLVQVLADGTVESKKMAAAALWNMATENEDNQLEIAEAGGIAPLIQLLAHGMPDAKEQAAGAISHVVFQNVANQDAVAEAGALTPLIKLLVTGTPQGRERAAEALRNLAGFPINPVNQVAIAQAGGIAPLIKLARECGHTSAPGGKARALEALMFLAQNNPENRAAIHLAGSRT